MVGCCYIFFRHDSNHITSPSKCNMACNNQRQGSLGLELGYIFYQETHNRSKLFQYRRYPIQRLACECPPAGALDGLLCFKQNVYIDLLHQRMEWLRHTPQRSADDWLIRRAAPCILPAAALPLGCSPNRHIGSASLAPFTIALPRYPWDSRHGWVNNRRRIRIDCGLFQPELTCFCHDLPCDAICYAWNAIEKDYVAYSSGESLQSSDQCRVSSASWRCECTAQAGAVGCCEGEVRCRDWALLVHQRRSFDSGARETLRLKNSCLWKREGKNRNSLLKTTMALDGEGGSKSY